MNVVERIQLVKAMEFICRHLNDETIFCDEWLTFGVADGDIPYGDVGMRFEDVENLACYVDDDHDFAALMDSFLWCMKQARRSGGLFCDNVVSAEKEANDAT